MFKNNNKTAIYSDLNCTLEPLSLENLASINKFKSCSGTMDESNIIFNKKNITL